MFFFLFPSSLILIRHLGGFYDRTAVSPETKEWIKQRLQERPEGLKIPENFVQTAPAHQGPKRKGGQKATIELQNPQTVAFLDLLDEPYNLKHAAKVKQPASHGRQNEYSLKVIRIIIRWTITIMVASLAVFGSLDRKSICRA